MTEAAKQDSGLIAFAKEIIRAAAFDACYLDGLDVQDIALKHGLIDREEYDPTKHGSHDYAEAGDDWYVFSGPLKATAS